MLEMITVHQCTNTHVNSLCSK